MRIFKPAEIQHVRSGGHIKHKVKKALNYVTDFEVAVAHEARARGHDGVVCGHIHRAEMRMIHGTLYCNDGDWVESRTALVEHLNGQLELIHWSDVPVRHPRSQKTRTALLLEEENLNPSGIF